MTTRGTAAPPRTSGEVAEPLGSGWRGAANLITLSRLGLDLLISISASPLRGVGPGGLAIERTYHHLLSTYAELFQCHVLFCNRVGCEDGVTFWGGSRAFSPAAGELATAPLFDETHLDVTLQRSHLRRARLATPLLADERPELVLRALERMARE